MSRGRGRGTGLSFNAELLGVGRGQEAIPASLLTPPPLYPPRLNPPCPLVEGPESDYLLAVHREFMHQMRQSGFYLPPARGRSRNGPAPPTLRVERYSDRYQTQAETPLILDWRPLPRELRPEQRPGRRKRPGAQPAGPPPNRVSRKTKDLTKTLDDLEKKEKINPGDESEDDGDKKAESDEDEANKAKAGEVEDSEGEVEDEEMDFGTDYANNYFDNGEDYGDDDDDNLDEGGIY